VGLEIRKRNTLSSPWTKIEPIRLGKIPAGLGTPDIYITVEERSHPKLRIDVYAADDEAHYFEEEVLWSNWLTIGFGEKVFLVEVTTCALEEIHLGSYFGSFHPGEGFLLIASADRIIRVNHNGKVVWRSDHLGLDGVLIERVEKNRIYGKGEWDPPGGWRDFDVCLNSGQAI
jgi:hypothetical protein